MGIINGIVKKINRKGEDELENYFDDDLIEYYKNKEDKHTLREDIVCNKEIEQELRVRTRLMSEGIVTLFFVLSVLILAVVVSLY